MTTQQGVNKLLIDYIDNLKAVDPKLARKKVMDIKIACGISNWVYGNWRTFRTPIKRSDQIVINKTLGIDLFPVETPIRI